MTWSVQVPNPLQVGGNGANGEIDILDTNGNVVGKITTSAIIIGPSGGKQVILTYNGTVSLIEFPTNLPYEAVPGTIETAEFTSGGRHYVAMVMPSPKANTDGQSCMDLYFLSGSDDGTQHASAAFNYAPDGVNFTDKFHINATAIGVDQSCPLVTINEVWHSPSYVNGFSNSVPGVTYRLMPDGTVLLRGRVTSPATTTANETMFTLPVGYRPTQDFNVMINQLAATTTFNKLHIDPSGNAQLGNPVSAITSFSLDGVRFAII